MSITQTALPTQLPSELWMKIFLFLENPTAKMIKNEISYYLTDHNWDLTKMYKMYYVHSFMDFDVYYFDRLSDPIPYNSYRIRQYEEYDNNDDYETDDDDDDNSTRPLAIQTDK